MEKQSEISKSACKSLITYYLGTIVMDVDKNKHSNVLETSENIAKETLKGYLIGIEKLKKIIKDIEEEKKEPTKEYDKIFSIIRKHGDE
jgi:hypothetical protein